MNCYLHPDAPGSAFCRSCGRALCTVCQRQAEGTIFCPDHAPAEYAPPRESNVGGEAANPYFAAGTGPAPLAPVSTSPGLAFILGLIPGVGAIYNGQYLKGLVHALFTGLLITILDNTAGSSDALITMLLVAFWIYMPFEAYHTAKRRQAGIVPDEWSSILPHGHRYAGRLPLGPIALIIIGVVYLLNSLNLVDFRGMMRFWPVILIVAGAYMLYSRVGGRGRMAPTPQKFPPAERSATGEQFDGKQA